jgi:hypothetical protein
MGIVIHADADKTLGIRIDTYPRYLVDHILGTMAKSAHTGYTKNRYPNFIGTKKLFTYLYSTINNFHTTYLFHNVGT